MSKDNKGSTLGRQFNFSSMHPFQFSDVSPTFSLIVNKCRSPPPDINVKTNKTTARCTTQAQISIPSTKHKRNVGVVRHVRPPWRDGTSHVKEGRDRSEFLEESRRGSNSGRGSLEIVFTRRIPRRIFYDDAPSPNYLFPIVFQMTCCCIKRDINLGRELILLLALHLGGCYVAVLGLGASFNDTIVLLSVAVAGAGSASTGAGHR